MEITPLGLSIIFNSKAASGRIDNENKESVRNILELLLEYSEAHLPSVPNLSPVLDGSVSECLFLASVEEDLIIQFFNEPEY